MPEAVPRDEVPRRHVQVPEGQPHQPQLYYSRSHGLGPFSGKKKLAGISLYCMSDCMTYNQGVLYTLCVRLYNAILYVVY